MVVSFISIFGNSSRFQDMILTNQSTLVTENSKESPISYPYFYKTKQKDMLIGAKSFFKMSFGQIKQVLKYSILQKLFLVGWYLENMSQRKYVQKNQALQNIASRRSAYFHRQRNTKVLVAREKYQKHCEVHYNSEFAIRSL